MTGREPFDDALDAALDALRSGCGLRDVLEAHASHAEALRPLLYTAIAAQGDAIAHAAPPPARLADNFTIVRAAVERAQMAPRIVGEARPPTSPPDPWWRRRLTFASLSLPAGIVAIVAFAGAGAAAAAVAVGGDNAISAIAHLPSRVQDIVPGGSDGGPGANTASHTATPGSNGNGPVVSPTENHPTTVTVEGIIGEITGNNFELVNVDGNVHVTIDGKTFVIGSIATGATATVDGTLTATKNLHADSVVVTADPASSTPEETPDDGVAPGHPATHTPKPEQTPGPPPSHTPKPDYTPGPPPSHTPWPERTPGPPEGRTPPGQGGGNEGGDGNGNPGAGEQGS